MKTKRNKTIGLCVAAVVLLGHLSFAERLWPLQVGQTYTYTQSAPSGSSWTVRIDVKGYTTYDSVNYFNIWAYNYQNNGTYENWGYVRSTEDEIFSNFGQDIPDFQIAPVGTKWVEYNPDDEYRYKVIEIVAKESVTVPYGHFEEAYKHRKYHTDDPDDLLSRRSPDWYEWVVPGVGFVKQEDFWVDGPTPHIMELVEMTQDTERSRITKFTAKAGKTAGTDSIQFSGVLGAVGLETLIGDEIAISLDADDMASPLEWTFPINASTFKNGNFNAKTADSSFRYSIKTGKMTFSAKNADLTGLACPLTVTITIGDVSDSIELDADVVNGPKKPCPPQFLIGVRNSMTVDRAQVKFGKSSGTDSLTITGFFTIGDDYHKSNPLRIMLGGQTFTVSCDQFKFGNFSESCTNAVSDEGPLVKAKFDFAKCTFQIQVRNMTISEDGVVPLGLMLFDQDLTGLATIDLGPKQFFSLENDFRHFNIPGTRLYSPGGYTIVTGTSGSDYYSALGLEDRVYWATDSDGTHVKRMLMAGEFYYCDIITSVLSNPSLMRTGQTFTESGSFTGSMNVWVPDEPSIDVDIYDFAGTLKVTTKTVGWQNIVVPAGAFNAYKIEQTFTFSGAMRVVIYDHLDGVGTDTTGTYSCTSTITYWCDPDIGIIKLIDTGREKVTAKGAGSLSDSWTQTKLLEPR